MLYWLQQERRAVQLNKVGEPEQLKQFVRDNHVTAIRKIAPEPHFPISFTNVKINQETWMILSFSSFVLLCKVFNKSLFELIDWWFQGVKVF